MLKDITIDQILQLIPPETELEQKLMLLPEVQQGLVWGKPRFGHPEGQVVYHVQEIYKNIDALPNLDTRVRRDLRLTALLHDAFKYCESKSSPRNWEFHHGAIASRFAQKHLNNPLVIDLIALHDEAYYCWRNYKQLSNDDIKPRYTVSALIHLISPFLQEYLLFFRCDTLTGDKNPAPLKWFEDIVAETVASEA
jgi:hypothetical protein